MLKKRLPMVTDEGLGWDTIMDSGLAMKWGVPYVHLVVFAIDVDRIRMEVEDDPDGVWPFGFEVFLTEAHLLGTIDADDPEQLAMLEDVCLAILDAGPDEDPPLGTQIVFAVYDAIERGDLPRTLRSAFSGWKTAPRALLEGLAPLFERPEVEAADLAMACLELELDPPLAAPTQDALSAMLETYETDAPLQPEPPAEG